MFDNIGGKCKAIAKGLCWTGIILSCLCGLIMIIAGFFSVGGSGSLYLVLYGFLVMIVGSVSSWLSSIGLYAIGEAAENSAIAANLAIKADLEREQQRNQL